VVVRTPALAWNGLPRPTDAPLLTRCRWPLSPLGTGLRLSAMHRLAPAFRVLPRETRARLVKETLGPAGAWWLRARIEGSVEVLTQHVLAGASTRGSTTVLSFRTPLGDAELEADHVLAATGYRVQLDRLGFLAPRLRDRIAASVGYPRLGPGFE